MWSNLSSSNNQAGFISLFASAISSLTVKHRLALALFATILTIALVVGLFAWQNAAARQASLQQTITSEKQTAVSAALPDASTRQQVSSVEQPPISSPTQTHASVSQSNGSTTVRINNETIPVPGNGSIQRTVKDDTGTTQVSVSNRSDSSGSSSSVSSSSVNMSTSSQSANSSISINNSQ